MATHWVPLPSVRAPFVPSLMDVVRLSACNGYRDQKQGETLEAYTTRLIDELEAAFLSAGTETIIGYCAETVSGATTGALPLNPSYFSAVRALCDQYDILYIADEVMCGMGRTGSYMLLLMSL